METRLQKRKAATASITREEYARLLPMDVANVPGGGRLADELCTNAHLYNVRGIYTSGSARCADVAKMFDDEVMGCKAMMNDATPRMGVEVVGVLDCEQVFRSAQFHMQERMTELELKKRDVTKWMWHMTTGDITAILKDGLDVTRSVGGFLGRGIYFTESMVKANVYSKQKGQGGALRVMLRCDVVVGLSHEYRMGHFDRRLTSAPAGHHSTAGLYRHAREVAVYRNDQVLVQEIVFYRFPDTAMELAWDVYTPTPPAVPGGFVVQITAALSEFFNKLKEMAETKGCVTDVQMQIRLLLKREIDIAAFIANVTGVLKSAAPPDLHAKIAAELVKCTLPPPPPPPAAPAV